LAQAEHKLQNNRSLIEPDEPSTKGDRKEERRKKATGGKGGGGTQVFGTMYYMMKYTIFIQAPHDRILWARNDTLRISHN
jgi:hypothetical protein